MFLTQFLSILQNEAPFSFVCSLLFLKFVWLALGYWLLAFCWQPSLFPCWIYHATPLTASQPFLTLTHTPLLKQILLQYTLAFPLTDHPASSRHFSFVKSHLMLGKDFGPQMWILIQESINCCQPLMHWFCFAKHEWLEISFSFCALNVRGG